MGSKLDRWLLAVIPLIGCAAAPPPAQSPAATPPERQELSELDALEHDLAVAAERVEREVARKAREPEAAETQTETRRDRRPSADEKKSEESATGDQGEPPADAEPRGRVGAPCDVACRALGSMKRSASRICAIAGETHERCLRAKSKVEDAARRVRGAACECRRERDEQLISSGACWGILQRHAATPSSQRASQVATRRFP